MRRRDGQERFIDGVACFFALVLFKVEIVVLFFELFKKVFRVFAPCTEVVLVEYNDVPICGMDELVFRLDAARFICAEQILEGAEYDDGLRFIARGVLLIQFFRIELCLFVGNELPAFEVHMVGQIFLPSRFNGWFERQHKNFFESHRLAKLVGGKRLSETHFCVP